MFRASFSGLRIIHSLVSVSSGPKLIIKAWQEPIARLVQWKEHWDQVLERLVSLPYTNAEGPTMHDHFILAESFFLLRNPRTSLGTLCIQVDELVNGAVTRDGEGNPVLKVLASAFRSTSILDFTGTYTALTSPQVEESRHPFG